MSDQGFDYIVVGAGASGCVLASRLSANPAIKVLVLEAGSDNPPGREHFAIRDPFPISLGYPDFSWPELTAEVGADKKDGTPRFSRRYLQGYGVGGGSNIQGMIALRGVPKDYDDWVAAGVSGWGWNDVLPYYKRLERDLDFDGPMHGKEGPIPVRRIMPKDWAPFAKAFADCAVAKGYPLIEDINGDYRVGVGPLPMANLPNQRVSVSMGYLDETVRRRPNLTIRANAHVDKIEIRGRKAIGVVLRGSSEVIKGGEIIVSAGSLHSPTILMRSGIGPGQHLQEHGIEVIGDLPAVGQHLMNHVNAFFAVSLPRSAAQSASHRGSGQSCMQLGSGLEDSERDMVVVAVNKGGWHPLGKRIGALAVEVHKTHSLGEVRLRSPRPDVTPQIKFNLLSDERDLARMMFGLTFCLEVLIDPRMKAVTDEAFLAITQRVMSFSQRTAWNRIRSTAIAALFELGPIRRAVLGDSKFDPKALLADPDRLRRIILERAQPPHHGSCTVRMGRQGDPSAAVDTEGRVFGIEGLRVADCSIMPTLVRANTHFPAIMIGEKISDTILQKRGH